MAGRATAARPPKRSARASRRLRDAIDAPAVVRNRRLDYLAANPAGRALMCEMFEADQPNQGRYVFLDPGVRRARGRVRSCSSWRSR